MLQLDLMFSAPPFGGRTYDESKDGNRLKSQLERVWEVMIDGAWHTLPELAGRVGGSEAGVSARIRDLRKGWAGGHAVERRRVTGGLWEYRMVRG